MLAFAIPALLATVTVASTGPGRSAATEPPAVRITLNSDRHYDPGEAVRVRVETLDDGYLFVMHVDTDGQLRVVFPIDPEDDNYVRGGRRYDLTGRGGRDAVVADRQGEGWIYAAYSRAPINLSAITLNGHWDYRAIAPQALSTDPENELNEIAKRVISGRFDYDLLPFDVGGRADVASVPSAAPVLVDAYPAYGGGAGWCDSYYYGSALCPGYGGYGGYGGYDGYGYFGGGLHVSIGIGRGYAPWYGGYCDPFWNTWCGGGWGYGWSRPAIYRPWGWGGGWGGWWNRPHWASGWSRPWGESPWQFKQRTRSWGGYVAPATFADIRYAAGARTTRYNPIPVHPIRDFDYSRGLGRRWNGPVPNGGRPTAPVTRPSTDRDAVANGSRPVRRGAEPSAPVTRPSADRNGVVDGGRRGEANGPVTRPQRGGDRGADRGGDRGRRFESSAPVGRPVDRGDGFDRGRVRYAGPDDNRPTRVESPAPRPSNDGTRGAMVDGGRPSRGGERAAPRADDGAPRRMERPSDDRPNRMDRPRGESRAAPQREMSRPAPQREMPRAEPRRESAPQRSAPQRSESRSWGGGHGGGHGGGGGRRH